MAMISVFLRRLGLSFCFVSFGVWELVRPDFWTGFVPSFADRIADPLVLVRLHGAALTIIGLAVLFGFYLRIAAGLAALMLLEIVAALWFESGFTDILVRDVAILLLAASLFVEAMGDRRKSRGADIARVGTD